MGWSFLIIGAIGFSVDSVILILAKECGLPLQGARLLSFSIAAITTGLLHRHFNFKKTSAASLGLPYIGIQITGFLCNYYSFLYLCWIIEPKKHSTYILILGVAAIISALITYKLLNKLQRKIIAK